MKKVPQPWKMAARPVSLGFRYATMLALTMTATSCDKSVLQDAASPTSRTLARLSGEPLFSSSYEIETFSSNLLATNGSRATKADITFAEIAAQPRLDRQSVSFKVFADGTYEMTTTQLDPTHRELLPKSIRDQKPETMMAYKTVVQNNVAHFYDKSGKETGKSELKQSRFNLLADKIIKSSEANREQIASEVMGHPLINELFILGIAKEKNAIVKTDRGITEIKFDLAHFAAESNESQENLSKYSVQYYDFKRKRLLGERLHDKQGDKLLYRSSLFYGPAEKGNQIEKVISESYNQDPKTGLQVKHLKETFYKNMRVTVNI